MKSLLLLLTFTAFAGLSQSKSEFIQSMTLDSVYTFNGEKSDYSDNCLLIKLSVNPESFIDSVIEAHQEDATELNRTENSVVLKKVTKPYWVYGFYEVYVNVERGAAFATIEIYHKSYGDRDHYQMPTAQAFYQNILNAVLNS